MIAEARPEHGVVYLLHHQICVPYIYPDRFAPSSPPESSSFSEFFESVVFSSVYFLASSLASVRAQTAVSRLASPKFPAELGRVQGERGARQQEEVLASSREEAARIVVVEQMRLIEVA